MLLSKIYAPTYLNFVDLCSVANISVIIFNEDLNGYYIHGKSPYGAADVNSLNLRLNLEGEK
jgi:meckelin